MGNKIDVNTRFYEPRDDENIVELLKKTFPKWAGFNDPLGLWRWKYIDIPLRVVIVVAVADNKIVGCNPSVIFNAKLGSEITSLGYSDDLAVDTDYRGLGIWGKIRALKEEKVASLAKYSFATTVSPIVLKSWVKRNRALLPFPVTRMVKTKDIDHLLTVQPMKNELLVKLGYTFLSNLNRISNLFRPPIKRLDEFQITQIPEFDESIDSFWMKIKDDYNFILEKKHLYLNWRFADNDRGSHVIFQAVNEDGVLGYVVVGFKPGQSEGQIVDLLALRDRLDVADALMGYACECLDDLGINIIFYQLVEGHPYQEVSRRHGFIDSRSRPNISFDYSVNWQGSAQSEIPFLKHTVPGQVYFNYATTI